ncbi:glycosyltransferase family 4 protein [Sphingomonas sp. BGYR3]|uniref:glycosyltransferase family 4 protein n=1 Tax=Sphingomonas sp. BGYR3 TaxID=2975483 RepID=UPI0021A82550|nr:glycosyltransferase family 4 protein [Sphingomonas sp. BGYR3]MDG5489274.1 glycosyltransferase family 4 protein [Sphingomonas sp. BGYR3]
MLRSSWSSIPFSTWREVLRRYPDAALIDTPRLDAVAERGGPLEAWGIPIRQSRTMARLSARIVQQQLDAIRPDVILSIGASHKLAYATVDCPVIHVTDGLFATICAYYSKYESFRGGALRRGNEDHRRLLSKIDMMLFASDWAMRSAADLYDVPEERMRVVPFGANLDQTPPFEIRRSQGSVSLVFVGYDWHRKGGPLALASYRALRARGVEATLDIIGCSPSEARGIDGVTVHGRLDKSSPADAARFAQVMRDAAFFIMPTRQEAFGIVFCEAAAHGLPVIATTTGGVPSVVDNGVTGHLLSLEDGPDAYAERIIGTWSDSAAYLAMSRAARTAYEERLNWRAWGDSLDQAIDHVLGRSR